MDGPDTGTGPRATFCTLGMFIVDDIYPPPTAPDQTPKKDVIGGAGTYAAIGARLFSPPASDRHADPHATFDSRNVAWIVDAGIDFPLELRHVVASWDTGVCFRGRDAPTTRGWNGYGENEHRAFKYLTEKKRLTADDLPPWMLRSRSFHLICSPQRCIEIVNRLLERRKEVYAPKSGTGGKYRPLIIWEPVPDLCTPEEFGGTLDALKYVDVLSPNHEELGALFGMQHPLEIDHDAVVQQVRILLNHGIGPVTESGTRNGSIVVRCGKSGCLYASNSGSLGWLPAYHTSPDKVVDPTGGGNGFLGGLAIGLLKSTLGNLKEAAVYGSVAASFCIEQVGMPVLTRRQDEGEEEMWNGVSVIERLHEFKGRIASSTT